MYLKRSLIKRQAKELLKGNVFKLFFIGLIVSFCVSIVSGVFFGLTSTYTFSQFNDMLDNYDDYFDQYLEDYGDLDDFDGEDFFNFGADGTFSLPYGNNGSNNINQNYTFTIGNRYGYIPFIITTALSPLAVTLVGLFVLFIRGKKFDFDEGLKSVFTNAFKICYFKKMGVYLLRMVIAFLLSFLLFIPAIIFNYSSYFAFQIMCDYPELSPWEAISLSKKMIKGNRFELFLLNLSFLPWALLCIFIFPIIYVMPYIAVTEALYYENFRLRAIQQGRVTEDDFLSAAQRCAKYGSMGNTQYYSPEGAQQGSYREPAPQQPYQNYAVPNQQYAPAPNTMPVEPQQPAANAYEAPAEPQEAPYEAPKPAEPTDYPWEGK